MRRALLAILLSLFGASHAQAFDCTKAKRDDEKAICADQSLIALDAAMAAAYKSVMAQLSPEDQQALKLSQRVWLDLRGNCGASAECLQMRIASRLEELSPRPASGPGGIALLPWFFGQQGDARHWTIEASGIKLAPPFKSNMLEYETVRVMRDLPRETIAEEEIAPGMTSYQYSVQLSASYLSPQFISVEKSTYVYSGGAHGNYGSSFINIDLRKDQAVKFYDIFRPGSEAAIITQCQAGIQRARAERNGDDGEGWDFRNMVLEKAVQLENWRFLADRAAVYFAAYEVGSFAEGEYECEMPISFLWAYLQPGNPWVE